MSENKPEIEGNAEFNDLEKRKNDLEEDKGDNHLIQNSGLLGSVKIINKLTGFVIGTTEYIALLIIDSFAKTFGLDTQGKSLNDILNMLYIVIEDPDVRDVLIKIMESFSGLLVIFIDELKEPMREVIDEMVDLGGESVEKMAKTLVSVSIDSLGAIPVAGEVIEVVRVFDTIVKQIQASVGVFLKTGVLLTSFIETGLGSVLPIKKSIEDFIAVINSFKDRIPTMKNMEEAAKKRANRMVSDAKDKTFEKTRQSLEKKKKEYTAAAVANSVRNLTKSEQQRSATAAPVSDPPSVQVGGMKKIKKDIRNKSNHIKKTIKRFLNRNSNIRNVTRRN